MTRLCSNTTLKKEAAYFSEIYSLPITPQVAENRRPVAALKIVFKKSVFVQGSRDFSAT
jgi:hypothetical protein